MIRWLGFLGLMVALSGRPVTAQRPTTEPGQSFVVLGHVRGGKDGPNPKLPEALNEVRRLHPAFVVLTGDMIWGDAERNPADTVEVDREWTYLDSALATLGVPAYRVPGNHDINDIHTRDIFRQRYGTLPRSVTVGAIRLLLLSSVWVPADGDTSKMLHERGLDLDTAQVAWLRRELAKPGFAHTFVFMHHLLWWETDSEPWWREVHPLLAAAKVDAVFSGDYGPLKFSTMSRDGVSYYQCSIEGKPALGNLRNIKNRILSSQFDNFLEVHVDGPAVDVRVHTVAAVSSGFFTPDHYRAVDTLQPPAPRPVPLWRRLLGVVDSPRRLALLIIGVGLIFGSGWWGRGRVLRRPT